MPDTSRDFYLNRRPLIYVGRIFQSFLTRYSTGRLILFVLSYYEMTGNILLSFSFVVHWSYFWFWVRIFNHFWRGTRPSVWFFLFLGIERQRDLLSSILFPVFIFFSDAVHSYYFRRESIISDSFERLILSNDGGIDSLPSFFPFFWNYFSMNLSSTQLRLTNNHSPSNKMILVYTTTVL